MYAAAGRPTPIASAMARATQIGRVTSCHPGVTPPIATTMTAITRATPKSTRDDPTVDTGRTRRGKKILETRALFATREPELLFRIAENSVQIVIPTYENTKYGTPSLG